MNIHKLHSPGRLAAVLLLLALTGAQGAVRAGQYTTLHEFGPESDNGTIPFGDLERSEGVVYGMTTGGGANGLGVIFRMNIDGGGFQVLHSFAGGMNDGAHGPGSLLNLGDKLIGMTPGGGSEADGVIFSMDTSGKNFKVVHMFKGWQRGDGAGPEGALAFTGLGMTLAGGTQNKGTVFNLNFATGETTILHSFLGGPDDGMYPHGSLTPGSGVNLGMASRGGAQDRGVIFSIESDGNGFKVLHSFSGAPNDGASPFGSLVAGSDGAYYGMTQAGGVNNQGVLFKISPDGSNYTVLFSFGTNGSGGQPWGSLIADGLWLYGMTLTGPAGQVFKIRTDGTDYRKLHTFDVGEGQFPKGSLIRIGSTLFGMTSSGGKAGDGVIFRLGDPPTLQFIPTYTTRTNYGYRVFQDRDGYLATWDTTGGTVDELQKADICGGLGPAAWTTIFKVANPLGGLVTFSLPVEHGCGTVYRLRRSE